MGEEMEIEPPKGAPPAGPIMKRFFITILITIGIIFLSIGLNPGIWGLIGIVCLINTAMVLYGVFKFKKKLRPLKLLWGYVMIIVFVHAFGYLAQYGAAGIALEIILIVAYIIISRWSRYVDTLRRFETVLYGKPLDRKEWAPGEFKNRTRRKLAWKKKGQL
jgi:hypothetical protein